MTENENRTRKQWLMVLAISMAISVGYMAYQPGPNPIPSELPDWLPQAMVAFTAVWSVVLGYIFYRCAYRKPGTKLLTFILIVMPIGTVLMIMGYASGKMPMPTSALLWTYTLVSNGLSVWWYVLNWKMRKINKKIKQSMAM